MTFFYNNNITNLLHKILIKNAIRKNKPNAQSLFEGKGQDHKNTFWQNYLQFADRRPSVKF